MKLRKTLSVLLAVLLVAALFTGCKNKPTGAKDAPATEPAEEEGIYVEFNGEKIKVGVAFEDMKDKLGKEIQPAETVYACDPDSDWQQTMHFYDGMIVTENKDGVIDSLQISGDTAALLGKIKVGATKDEVKDVLGKPDTDESWGIYYENTNPTLNFNLEEDEEHIMSIMVMLPTD